MAEPVVATQLEAAFGERALREPAVPLPGERCERINRVLASRSWKQLASSFVAGHADILPLLSDEAYAAFLPAWLLEAVRDPDGDVAAMVLLDLSENLRAVRFSAGQARAVVAATRQVGATSLWCVEDPVCAGQVRAIEASWWPAGQAVVEMALP